jgi:hypothetical protein
MLPRNSRLRSTFACAEPDTEPVGTAWTTRPGRSSWTSRFYPMLPKREVLYHKNELT